MSTAKQTKQTKQTKQEPVPITFTYTIPGECCEGMKRFIDLKKSDIKTEYNLNEPSEYKSLFITTSTPSIILFDNALFAIKNVEIIDENKEKKIYEAISINDLTRHYKIDSNRIQAFKRFYSNTISKSENVKNNFNQSNIPLTDKSNKWLIISYLIPFLMLTCESFANRMSNNLLPLLVKTSYTDETFEDICKVPESLIQQIPPIRFGLIKNKVEHKETVKKDLKHFIVFQKQKPIIPRLISDSKSDKTNLETYMKEFKIDPKKIESAKIETLIKFYNKLNEKLYNPADMLIVKSIIKNQKLINNISIIKVEGEKIDEEELNKLKGIKTKKVKENEYTSLECYDIKYDEIIESATLANLCKCGKIDLKPKSKIEGDQDLYKKLLNISKSDEFKKMLEESKTRPKREKVKKEIVMPSPEDEGEKGDDEGDDEEKEDEEGDEEGEGNDDEITYDV